MGKIDFSAFSAGGNRPVNPDNLREECWKHNQWAKRIGFDRWWTLRKIQHDGEETWVIDPRDGDEALRIRALLDGWYPDYVNWPADKLAGEFRILRHVARMGMPQALFEQIKLAA